MRTQNTGSREPDYVRLDDDSPCRQVIRCYFEPDIILAVSREHGLRGYGEKDKGIEVISHPSFDDGIARFVIVKLHCSKNQLKRAQFEWVQRMIANPPKKLLPEPEPSDLFI